MNETIDLLTMFEKKLENTIQLNGYAISFTDDFNLMPIIKRNILIELLNIIKTIKSIIAENHFYKNQEK